MATSKMDAALSGLLKRLEGQRSTLVRRATRALPTDGEEADDIVMVLDVRLRVSPHAALTDIVLPDGDDATRIVLSSVLHCDGVQPSQTVPT